MGDTERMEDKTVVDRLLKELPTTAVPASLQARILADFDAVALRRAPGRLMRLLGRWRDAVWPGAPVWQPATLLALSLAIGLIAGSLVPASSFTTTTTASSEQNLTAVDTTSSVDLYKDL